MASIVLGIDPGLRYTGYAVLSNNGTSPELLEAGTIKTIDSDSLEKRLKSIYDELQEIITEFKPDAVSVERLYSHYKHPQTAVVMGHARGIIYLCAANHNLVLNSYASTRIKKALTGNGRASKIQMQRAVKDRFNWIGLKERPDIADAVAAALCHIEAMK